MGILRFTLLTEDWPVVPPNIVGTPSADFPGTDPRPSQTGRDSCLRSVIESRGTYTEPNQAARRLANHG